MKPGGWTLVRRCWRFHGVAADGQAVHMYFSPYRDKVFTFWTVGLFIGRSKRVANDWHNKQKKQPPRTTGRGTLAALLYAQEILLEFAGRLTKYEELQVSWEDERRHRAYRRLLRLPNWQELEGCLHYRNPTWWEDTTKREVN